MRSGHGINESECKEEHNLELTVPSLSLKSSILVDLGQKENKENVAENKGGAPDSYWLRPQPVQLYPYNFIMAVRKKLEQITYASVQNKENSQMPPPPPPAERRNFHFKNNANRAPFAKHSTIRSSATRSEALPSARPRGHGLSERESDTQDTLSISSGILSHSSPEKEPSKVNLSTTEAPSPLSTDHIDGLHISSKSANQSSAIRADTNNEQAKDEIASFVNFNRGNAYEKLEPLRETIDEANDRLDVQQMFSEFNQNLSQAIEVNQRLHSLLSKSSSLRSGSASGTNIYSDDFENASRTNHSSHSKSISNQNRSPGGANTIQENAVNSQTTESTVKTIADSVGANGARAEPKTNSNSSPKSFSGTITEQIIATETRNSSAVGDENSFRSLRKYVFDERDMMSTSSIGANIYAVFKQTALQFGPDLSSTAWSDGNRSLSSLGKVST